MTCVDVRDRLTEHALGLLSFEELTEMERHLEECPGCRKEAVQLQEGVETVSLALLPAEPAPGLEDRVIGAVARSAHASLSTAGPGRRAGRRPLQVLAAATLAVVLVATGAVAWPLTQRLRGQDTRTPAQQTIARLPDLIAALGGQPLFAQLLPSSRYRSSGFAVIVSTSAANNFVFVDIPVPPTPDTGPYTVQLVDRSARVLSLGQLSKSDSGDLSQWFFPEQDLSKALTVSILDRSSNVVMSGKVHPYSKG
jgi:hypothetical protein